VNARDDGGQAFPVMRDFNYVPGMTLRDYFAAKAMAAVIATPEGFTVNGAPHLAEIAYEMADAMLAERNKP
jgi:hypothetical protein